MSEKVGKHFISSAEKPQQCDDCGEVAELRPYGPPGLDGKPTHVCHKCMMKDEEAAKKVFQRLLESD